MTGVRRVAVVSTGVIGASWAAHFLAHGLDVVATDPAPGAEERLRAEVTAHWPVLEQIGLSDGASPERLSFTADPAEAVADADVVQENGPEREDVKHALFGTLDAAARRTSCSRRAYPSSTADRRRWATRRNCRRLALPTE